MTKEELIGKVFKVTDFPSSEDFAKEMFRCGKLFKDDQDVSVVYAKPEDANGNIVVQFSIIRRQC